MSKILFQFFKRKFLIWYTKTRYDYNLTIMKSPNRPLTTGLKIKLKAIFEIEQCWIFAVLWRPFWKWRPVENFQCRDIIIYPHMKCHWNQTIVFRLIVFFINNIKIHSFTSLTGVGGLFNVILVGTGVQLKLRKHPNAYIAIKWNLNLLVITFSTTLTDAIG